MAPSVAWYPDPTGRYSHRWWDGHGWTGRVYADGAVAEDATPVTVPAGQKLHCGVCHVAVRKVDWSAPCRRCSVPLTQGYLATRPRRELKAAELVQAAQVSFDDVLAEVDRALAAGDECGALRRLDTAITYGTVLRSVASASSGSSAKAHRPEPLTLPALIELHLQALRLHARLAAGFDPTTFEVTLLHRIAAMYAPRVREHLPESVAELVEFAADRTEVVEAECPMVNDAAAHYASAYDWPRLRLALARLGYEFPEEERRIGKGVFEVGEQGRQEAAALLGVDAEIRPAALKKAYYRAAAQHHPDRLGEAPEDLRRAAEERMKEINAAYELLSA